MNNTLFSILTPAVQSRFEQVQALCKIIAQQIDDAPVEHLVLFDNKQRTVGEKRDALLRAARGDYIAFVDDDDMIAPDYVTSILQKIRSAPDVITFRQEASVNGETAIVEFRLGSDNAPFKCGMRNAECGIKTKNSEFRIPNSEFVRRNAWHVCAWRRTLAIQSHFPSLNYGEDWAFAEPLCKIAKSEEHIDKVLHYYRHSSAATEAPPPRNAEFGMRNSESKTSFPPADQFHVATGC
jgi:hypothetical protein